MPAKINDYKVEIILADPGMTKTLKSSIYDMVYLDQQRRTRRDNGRSSVFTHHG